MLNWFDIVAAVLTILMVLRGVVAGIAHTLADLFALVVGIFVARYLVTDFAGSWLAGLPAAAYVPLFLVAWFGTYFLIGFALRLLLRLAKIEFISPLEQIGGLVLGTVKVIVVLGMILNLSAMFPGGSASIKDTYTSRIIGPLWALVPLPRFDHWTLHTRETPGIDQKIEILSRELKKSLPMEALPLLPKK